MKKYNVIASTDELIISNNQNYVILDNNKEKSIIVKSGVHTNILTYNDNEEINLNVTVEKDATLNICHIIETKKDYKINEKVYLTDEGATAQIMAVILAMNEAVVDSKITIFHEIKNTSSQLLTYAVGKESSKINIDNNAYIKKKASNSNARQSAKGLSLNNNTQILVNPNLFIDEYDVMASHGVAIGSINKDDLFYLMSRGLTKEAASNMVIMGLIEPVLKAIDNEEYATKFRNNFQQNLK